MSEVADELKEMKIYLANCKAAALALIARIPELESMSLTDGNQFIRESAAELAAKMQMLRIVKQRIQDIANKIDEE